MAEVRLPAPVKATLVDDIDIADGEASGAVPGAFEFTLNHGDEMGAPPSGMIYVCPCGCGRAGFLGFRGRSNPERPSWIWDGNREAPTLSPSVHHVGHWHGYLRGGYWTQA